MYAESSLRLFLIRKAEMSLRLKNFRISANRSIAEGLLQSKANQKNRKAMLWRVSLHSKSCRLSAQTQGTCRRSSAQAIGRAGVRRELLACTRVG